MSYKVALVTGAAAGIGAECARRLSADGIAIGVLDLDAERCADTVKSITDRGAQAIALGADVSNREQVFAAVQKLRDAFGPVTILVNNAGISKFVPFDALTDAHAAEAQASVAALLGNGADDSTPLTFGGIGSGLCISGKSGWRWS